MSSSDSIARVVAESRAARARNGHLHLLWGVVVLVATVLQLAFAYLELPHGWVGWPVLAGAAAVYSFLEGRRLARTDEANLGTRVEGDTWEATAVAVLAAALLGPVSGAISPAHVVSVASVMVGVAIVASGAVYLYRFVKVAGYAFIVGGVGSFFLDWPWPHVIFAVLVVVAYIIPGVAMIRGASVAN